VPELPTQSKGKAAGTTGVSLSQDNPKDHRRRSSPPGEASPNLCKRMMGLGNPKEEHQTALDWIVQDRTCSGLSGSLRRPRPRRLLPESPRGTLCHGHKVFYNI